MVVSSSVLVGGGPRRIDGRRLRGDVDGLGDAGRLHLRRQPQRLADADSTFSWTSVAKPDSLNVTV